MTLEFDSILDQSISQIAAGKARLESCLLAYPTMASELEPLLRVAEMLRAIPKPALSPAARARIEEQVLVAAGAHPRLFPPAKRAKPFILPSWRLALNTLTVAVIVVFLLMTTLVTASADALPGSMLYPVKLATEDAWFWVTPEQSKPALHLRMARRRLEELEELAKQGAFDESALEDMTHHVDAALDGMENLSPAIALPLLDETAGFLEEQQASLSSMLDVLPSAARSAIETALDRSIAQAGRVESLNRKMQSNEPATPTGALEMVNPLAVTGTPTPTQIAEPTLTPTVEPSGPAPLSPTPEPTTGSASGSAAEPSATPLPAATQPPAPTQPPLEPTQPPPEPTQPPPEPTQPPPEPTQPPPEPTQPPPAPTATQRVPPGLTRTPEPPGLTKTPRPANNSKP
jgi:hypothetical protein